MKNAKKRFYIFLLIWLCVDFIQAGFTNVHPDEAYYALYGQYLAWGYYDHPPMVALLTYLSHFIALGPLSIRFFTVLLRAGTLLLLWKTLHDEQATERDVNEFFLIVSSLFMFVLYGFITTPDAPLLFFVALFFYLYKRYLAQANMGNALLIALCMAGMLYSKYMAVPVIGLVLLSNLKLLKDWRLWLAVGIAALLFLPHVLWQFNNDFPSFKYHLLLRNDSFSWAYPLEYLPNQLLVFNPVCFGLGLYFCWKERKNKDKFVKACVFTCVGLVAFFWLMTVNGHGEPHWTISISIPLLYLLYKHTREQEWRKRLLYAVLPFSLIVLVVRIALCTPFVPEITGFDDRSQKMAYLHQLCGSTPVVFYDSFQNPSLYHYFTGEKATALSSIHNRQTQYDILQLDKEWQGQEVCVFSPYYFPNAEKLEKYDLYYRKIPHFQGTNRIDIEIESQEIEGETLILDVTFHNNYEQDFVFQQEDYPVQLSVEFLAKEELISEPFEQLDIQEIPALGTVSTQLRCPAHPGLPFVLCLNNRINLSINSDARN